MKKLSKLIPEYDKLVPILFLLLLNLVTYANMTLYNDNMELNFYNLSIYFISIVYSYIISTPKITSKDFLLFMLCFLLLDLITDTAIEFNLLSIVFIIIFYRDRQKMLLTILRVILGLVMMYIFHFMLIDIIKTNMLVYSVFYFPFSFLIYKGAKCYQVNGFSQRK